MLEHFSEVWLVGIKEPPHLANFLPAAVCTCRIVLAYNITVRHREIH
jgi:hypothetical protein